MNIEIAPKFTCTHWDSLKPHLDPNGAWATCPEQWKRAIEVLQSRIEKRFFAAVAPLERVPYAGFAVLALDCLLIETIQAFRTGKSTRTSTESRTAHAAFLTTALEFQRYFSIERANDFYTNVRNGLLHDGETRKGWLVKSNSKYALVDPQLGDFFIVNRDKFHKALVKEFGRYLKELRDPDQNALRKNLVSALDGLCKRSRP